MDSNIFREIRFYIKENIRKYLVFSLICSGFRIIGLAMVWGTLAYYLDFGLQGKILLIVLGTLYIYSEIANFIFKRNAIDKLYLEDEKWA